MKLHLNVARMCHKPRNLHEKIYRHNGSDALSQRGRGVAFVPEALFSLCLTADVGHLGQLSFVRFRPWSDQSARLLRTQCERAEKSASPCPVATNDIPTCAGTRQGAGDQARWTVTTCSWKRSPTCSAHLVSLTSAYLSLTGL